MGNQPTWYMLHVFTCMYTYVELHTEIDTSAHAMQGPSDTPFEGGTFELVINVPEQYPLVPPNVRYRTKVFHPNVHFKVCAA